MVRLCKICDVVSLVAYGVAASLVTYWLVAYLWAQWAGHPFEGDPDTPGYNILLLAIFLLGGVTAGINLRKSQSLLATTCRVLHVVIWGAVLLIIVTANRESPMTIAGFSAVTLIATLSSSRMLWASMSKYRVRRTTVQPE